MHALKLIRIDDSVGLILPKEVLAKLKRGAGDTVFLAETVEGLLLSPHDPALQNQLDAGREFIDDYSRALRALTE
ncbi:AbrB/MazE/SpoVT family DNA-binding domain-containing protein [Noviherbaspirillum sp.]|uniref:AbrB/MazE/SpoVT family DNA-binding domain-containing protein n=1 Tax=Noviherbaspirillum sp. TaxID=1926288 RepID=UPI002B463368|nr:AbrB/MazE/SpoVT family DNA-binding domain-containing protein [Noviherbaspirillum sp.]HJV81488.1 AbrB/MazE/SpoVT family DNA-binding domain-containing protein [Noviherbaspirillum sp.]